MLAISLTQLNLININQEEQEIWKTHSSGYEVSSFGRVKGKLVDFLKPRIDLDGYLMYGLSVNNKIVGKSAHRLVAETFIGDVPFGMVVNHKDGDKLNPKLSNLEIVTEKQNSLHAIKTGLHIVPYGENHSDSILTEAEVLQIYDMLKQGKPIQDISFQFNIKSDHVYSLRAGRTWRRLYEKSGMTFQTRKKRTLEINKELLDTIFFKYKNKEPLTKISEDTRLPYSTIQRITSNGYNKAVKSLIKKNNFKKISVDKLPGEKWKLHIKSGRYVSNFGRIIGFFGKILNPTKNKKGYRCLRFKSKGWAVHRLVWETFKGEIPPKMEINHLNRDKSDNRLSNLEMVTHQENVQHCCLTRKIIRGSESKTSKLDEGKVRDIRIRLKNGERAASLAREYGVSKTVIGWVKSNKIWRHVV